MDGRKKNGGKRQGAGRPAKADEIKLIERMDAIAAPEEIWQLLHDKCKDGDTQALKTWVQYRFGMPKQTIDQNNTHILNSFDLSTLYDPDKET